QGEVLTYSESGVVVERSNYLDDLLEGWQTTASTNKTLKVEAPAARSAGIKVKSVAELVEKLKNEAKVI
ncbi:hypothetical protein ACQKQA_30455, partial [Pseudomonas sp. NPDC089530]